ncbi:MAG: nuclease-related domain-containing protein [Opitutaceae bacterium]|nr:nuclease-related domain-containing protein [Opitutaceae bacterium]
MNQQLGATAFLSGYLVLFLIGVGGIGFWRIKRRRETPPLEFKLLRGPGESLRQRMNKFDQDFLLQVGGAAIAPVAAGLVTVGLLAWLAPQLQPSYGLAIIAAVFIGALVASGNWALRRLLRDRDDRLGYLGERSVGETLGELVERGYRVFHDLPAGLSAGAFNIDHVVIGANGIFAIETKTRRKEPARPGHEPHKVAYDGKRLIWPWAEETLALEQAEARARWLSEWLHQTTGVEISALPVLVLPGWYVTTIVPGTVMVVNHKLLSGAITRAHKVTLGEEQIETIARQLEERCRDVED